MGEQRSPPLGEQKIGEKWEGMREKGEGVGSFAHLPLPPLLAPYFTNLLTVPFPLHAFFVITLAMQDN